MICTHGYLNWDGTLYSHNGSAKQSWESYDYVPGINDGEDLWQKLVSRHANVVFVFCGHVVKTGAARLTSKGVYGNDVYQMLADYQMRAQGGEGYLRLVEFLPDGKTVQVKSYSPLLDNYLTDDAQQFTLDLPPRPK